MVVEHVVCGPEELLIFMMFGHEFLTGSFVESAGFDVFSFCRERGSSIFGWKFDLKWCFEGG